MESVESRVVSLAERLGQSVADLWPHAVRYVVVASAVELAVTLLLMVGWVWAARFAVRGYSKVKEESRYDEEIWWAGLAIVVLGFSGIVLGCFFHEAVVGLIEPTGSLVVSTIKQATRAGE